MFKKEKFTFHFILCAVGFVLAAGFSYDCDMYGLTAACSGIAVGFIFALFLIYLDSSSTKFLDVDKKPKRVL